MVHAFMQMKPVLAITMGDAAGIGPEIVLKSFSKHSELFDLCRPLVIGSAEDVEEYEHFSSGPLRRAAK